MIPEKKYANDAFWSVMTSRKKGLHRKLKRKARKKERQFGNYLKHQNEGTANECN